VGRLAWPRADVELCYTSSRKLAQQNIAFHIPLKERPQSAAQIGVPKRARSCMPRETWYFFTLVVCCTIAATMLALFFAEPPQQKPQHSVALHGLAPR